MHGVLSRRAVEYTVLAGLAVLCLVTASVQSPSVAVLSPRIALITAGLVVAAHLVGREQVALGSDRGSRSVLYSVQAPFVLVGATQLPVPWMLVLLLALPRNWSSWRSQLTDLSHQCITMMMAAMAYWWVLGGAQAGWAGMVTALTACSLIFVMVNAAVVSAVIWARGGPEPSQLPIWTPTGMILSVGEAGVGAVASFCLYVSPWTLVLLAPVVALLGLQASAMQAAEGASHDARTGLLNQPTFRHIVGAEIARARRHDRQVSVIMLDLDHLRELNSSFGHLAGDAAIAAVADRLREQLREEDFACRWGGEEYTVLLPDTRMADAFAVADRIRRAIASEGVPFAPGMLSVTTSAGVAELSPEDTVDSLLQRADDALYSAKEQGRNRVEVLAATSARSPSAPSTP